MRTMTIGVLGFAAGWVVGVMSRIGTWLALAWIAYRIGRWLAGAFVLMAAHTAWLQ